MYESILNPVISSLLIFLATGAIAGFLAGLFGIGGGMVMVPALVFVLSANGVAPEIVVHVALGTSLAVIALSSISSTRSHHRRGGVRWDLLRSYGPALAIGALVGALVADVLTGNLLKRLVGLSSLLIALQMAFDYRFPALSGMSPPRAGELSVAGGLIGMLSSLIGIGGGSLTGPYLAMRGFEMRHTVGTAAAGGIPIAWAGAAGYVVAGWGVSGVPQPAFGYVSGSALLALGLASTLMAPLGARCAHQLSPRRLQLAFAAMLGVVGGLMLFG